MQFPESWLREFCNPPLSTSELAETLTMAGLEVEELRPVAPPFTHVVVGEIRDAQQHPNADRLRVCQVDVGQADLLIIVCGAPNARVGIKVPCALVGAELPPAEGGKPFVIKVGKLRGVESAGMLCSARELGLTSDQDGLLELPADAVVGKSIREQLQLDDTLFTLKLTPNLAHALSVYGIAREVAALTGAPLRARKFEPVAAVHAQRLPVVVSAPDLCGRFSGRVLRNVNPQARTPAWMVERLARCGQRSVSALVDISNYVMFEFGRPSHIFDLDKIHGALDVRWARPGETLKLLNGNTVALDETVGVIADAQQVESLAGIMGGDSSAVGNDTRNVYVEAAFWWPKAVAGRSRRYNFSTDAGHRFERGVDPSQTVEHIEHITRLVLDICGGEAGPVDDLQGGIPAPAPVRLRVARASLVIGMPLTVDGVAQALERLGLPVERDGDTVTVTPPPYRFDLVIEEDLIEEVARIIGYENLPATAPLAPTAPKLRAESQRSSFAVRRALAALGYQETINFSFVEERWERELAGNAEPIKLLNPIASQLSVMRSSLLGSLVQVLKFNLDRKAPRVRVFEIGRIFRRDTGVLDSDTTVAGFDQPMRVAGLAYGPADVLQWGRKDQSADFFDLKGDVEALFAPARVTVEAAEHPALHPGRCARVLVDGEFAGHIGELHPRWRQAYDLPQAPVVFELALDVVQRRAVPLAVPVAKYQSVERDIAVVAAESVAYADVVAAAQSAASSALLRHIVLFDVYRPKAAKGDEGAAAGGLLPGQKSLALRLTLGSDSGTLTDEQIDAAVQSIVARIAEATGARLRA